MLICTAVEKCEVANRPGFSAGEVKPNQFKNVSTSWPRQEWGEEWKQDMRQVLCFKGWASNAGIVKCGRQPYRSFKQEISLAQYVFGASQKC